MLAVPMAIAAGCALNLGGELVSVEPDADKSGTVADGSLDESAPGSEDTGANASDATVPIVDAAPGFCASWLSDARASECVDFDDGGFSNWKQMTQSGQILLEASDASRPTLIAALVSPLVEDALGHAYLEGTARSTLPIAQQALRVVVEALVRIDAVSFQTVDQDEAHPRATLVGINIGPRFYLMWEARAIDKEVDPAPRLAFGTAFLTPNLLGRTIELASYNAPPTQGIWQRVRVELDLASNATGKASLTIDGVSLVSGEGFTIPSYARNEDSLQVRLGAQVSGKSGAVDIAYDDVTFEVY